MTFKKELFGSPAAVFAFAAIPVAAQAQGPHAPTATEASSTAKAGNGGRITGLEH